ncbi:PREDICTED: multidrug resistance-associated protein 5-like isoform X1 [Vollenhovia emeryi]|uniref:multidrug resistance-associated protein 5-like isoform X1 n=1 Tax=Vollenhovia emeryi TaxID=411798 RepID=UPI0005F40734|nr:PREDICTED: multidrug resistance-associated protein 5-like isoform X1 [Vollenhovia emeryi]XP_011878654.1 PREDICTED: multidrug resistance-associated protein 5-like isoform X1 [Vollenhovia emeryi]XP_011878655.1 PREDICTED: multidrug resistance-associated protein 5-like isoform X1 [Vollenhovia emeryi]XP_011878656.1 PREDICTED: multidrug resistance-associated protein 5-like isoform X1 [Vollenhovia emeryi]
MGQTAEGDNGGSGNDKRAESNAQHNEGSLEPDRQQQSLLPKASGSTARQVREYIPRSGMKKYNHALSNLIPIRQQDQKKENSPADNAGLFSYVYITWMTPYLWKAYKKGLTIKDLPDISVYDTCEYNALRLDVLWQQELSQNGPNAASFSTVAWRFVRTRVYVSCVLLTCSLIFGFISPTIIMRKILEHVQSPEENFWDGFKWVVLLTVCDSLRAFFFTWTWNMNYKTGLRLKSACTTLLYKKIMRLNSLGNKSIGEVISLFCNDSQRLFDVIIYGPMIISGPIVITCGIIYVLWLFNPIALVGMIAFLSFYPCQYFISRATGYFRAKSVNITDARVRLMGEILECIKLIKMYSWEKYFGQKLLAIRKKEERWLHKTAYFQSLSISLTPAIPVISAIITFLAHIASGSGLTAAQAFPMTTLFGNLLRLALTSLKDTTRYFMSALVALRRFKSILLLDEDSCQASKPIVRSQAVAIANGTFVCDSIKLQTDASFDNKKKKKLPPAADNPLELESLNQPTQEAKYVEVLSDVHFGAPKGKLVGICGQVGSGKSSLLLAALGQLRITKGHILREGTCAYVSQQAWIVNGTFKENILFGEEFDAKRYYHTITICNLKEDLNMLPGGDDTEIGERGVNLSGGQKQRVALARAYYANRDIYFLDDPLSAVDAYVGSYIFEKLFLEALRNKSVIFVTHNIQFLKRCDEIYMMSAGKIVEHGTHEELMRLDREYASMVKNSTVVTEDNLSAVKSTGVAQRNIDESEMRKTESAHKENDGKEKLHKGTALTVAEKSETGSVKSYTYHTYVQATGGYLVAILVFFTFFLNVGSSAFSTWWLAVWIKAGGGNVTVSGSNDTVYSENINANPDFSFYRDIYGACIAGILLTSFIRGLVIMFATIKASTTLHNTFLHKIINSPLSFFETTPSGRIQNVFTRDIDEIDNYLPISIENMVQNIFTCSFAIFFICGVLPWFSIPLLLFGVLFFFVGKLFRIGMRDLKRMDNVSRSPVLSFVTTSIQGLSTIHAFQKEKNFLYRFEELFNTNNLCQHLCQAAMRWSAVRLDSLVIASSCITALLVISFKNEISPAFAGLAMAYATQMTGVFQYTVRLMSETEVRFISVERISYYLKTLQREGASRTVALKPADDWPSRGKIEFKAVQMRYREELPLILIDVTFNIKAGEKIGIVGRTGSGKSSLVVALFRLVEICEGMIKIDGIDISKLELDVLRSKLSIIPQDPILFSGTIRSNLDPFQQHADSDIWSALEKTQMKDKVSLMSGNLDASVGFGGNNLSVGERQLLCLSRALLHSTKVLILDEATASVDPETEATVQNTLQNEFADCTVLTIAHRLQTVVTCDRILVMSEGKVVEFDAPAALLSRPDSEFSKLMTAADENA